MSLRSFYLPAFILSLLILGNGFIYLSTKENILSYKDNPPFRLDDFTQSYRLSSKSKLLNLLDGDPDTRWIKLQEGLDDRDWEVELKLTHKWNGEEYSPQAIQGIQVVPCSYSRVTLTPILREAINVDKVQRLPDDEILYSKDVQTKASVPILLPLNGRLNMKSTEIYPEGISILLLRGKFHSKDGCIQDIRVY